MEWSTQKEDNQEKNRWGLILFLLALLVNFACIFLVTWLTIVLRSLGPVESNMLAVRQANYQIDNTGVFNPVLPEVIEQIATDEAGLRITPVGVASPVDIIPFPTLGELPPDGEGSPEPTDTTTAEATIPSTDTSEPTEEATQTATAVTGTPSLITSPTPTSSRTGTPTPSRLPSRTPTPSRTGSPVPSRTPSRTPTPAVEETLTATPSYTPSATPSRTPSTTPSYTPTVTPSRTPSATPSRTPSATPSYTNTPPATFTPTATRTNTPPPTNTPTNTPPPTNTPTNTFTNTPPPTNTPTDTPVIPTETPSDTPASPTDTPTLGFTASPIPTDTFTPEGNQYWLQAATYPGNWVSSVQPSPPPVSLSFSTILTNIFFTLLPMLTYFVARLIHRRKPAF